MKILFFVLLFIICLNILNVLFLAFYCRIERRIDRKLNTQKKADCSSEKNSEENNKSRRRKMQWVKDFYKYLDHYFYGWMRFCIIKVGKIPSNRIRKVLYRFVFCMNINRKTVISAGCEIRSPWNIYLGNCIIAGNCILDGRSGIEIKDNAVLGMNVHIWTQEHDINSASFAVTDEHKGKVVINERAWVCSDSTLLPGVVVGEGAVIASKALACKNCEPYVVYGGVPAKKIAERNQDLTYVLSGKPHWHFN